MTNSLFDVKIISVSVVDDHVIQSIEPHEVSGPEFTTVISAEYTDQHARRLSREEFTSFLLETSDKIPKPFDVISESSR